MSQGDNPAPMLASFEYVENPDEPLELFCPEEYDCDFTTFAPEADDFPLGCFVSFVDLATARELQPEIYWESIMDDVFSDRKVVAQVKRHSNEHTFVEFPFKGMTVGMTVFRACLKLCDIKPMHYKPKFGVSDEFSTSAAVKFLDDVTRNSNN